MFEVTAPHRRRPRFIGRAAVVGCCALASCTTTTDEPPPDPVTLSVVGRPAAPTSLRAHFVPNIELKDADRVQDLIVDNGQAIVRSVLRLPFHSLDVAVEGDDARAATSRLRARLSADRSVVGVDTCPCPEEPVVHPEGLGIHKLARTCAAVARPASASGCVNKFTRVQAIPITLNGGPSQLYALTLEARAARTGHGRRVQELKARVGAGGSGMVVWRAPAGIWEFKAAARLPLSLAGFGSLDKSGHFSPGELYARTTPKSFNVTTTPLPSVRGARLEAAVAIAVPISEELQERYDIVVQYR